jgi:hypothetical protein
LALLLPLAAASCASRLASEPAEQFPPVSYDYLTPIRLNVASVAVDQRFVPGTADLGTLAPSPPSAAIRQMVQDRIQALGTVGSAVVAINDASIVRRAGGYEGSLAIELDIYTSANTRTAFAEARVSARRGESDGESQRRSLYELTKTLMDTLNVEFEYQVRRSLREWLVAPASGAPAPVEQQSLPPPKV